MLALLGSIACVFSWIPACNAIVGIEPREPAQDQCETCVAQSCSAEVAACRQDAPCTARLDCNSACDVDDDACHDTCSNPESLGDPEVAAAVDSCRATKCSSACAIRCGGVPALTPSASAGACERCAATSCCAEEQACAANADCVRIRECLRDHTSADAVSTCTDVRYPGGSADYHTYDACLSSSCSADCAYGALWTCVGHIKAPLASKDTVTVNYLLSNGQKPIKGIPGIQLRACRTSDVTCLKPLTASVTTGADGTASLTLPASSTAGATGFDGYIEIVDTKNVYITSLLFSGMPIVEDVAQRTVTMIAIADLASLAKFAGLTADPDHGYIAAAVTDCAARLAPRVTITTDPIDGLTHGYYNRVGIFSPAATDTDATGLLAVINVPAGLVTMTATSEDLGKATSVVSASVRPNALSLIQLTPTVRN